jgi:hypothetical protein
MVQGAETQPTEPGDYANYIRRSMRIFDDHRLTMCDCIDQDRFFELLEEERERIWQMENSLKASFDLVMDIKLNLLQGAEQTRVVDPQLRMWHEMLEVWLSGVMPLNYSWTKPTALEYVDAANACQDVRERMNRHRCEAYPESDEMCLYNLLLPTLDTLQRRAYEEIRLNVDASTAGRLPAGLSFLVFEFTMAAEEMPMDPRIFVNAIHRNMEGIEGARKTRLVCPHWAKQHDRLQIVPKRLALVWGDD